MLFRKSADYESAAAAIDSALRDSGFACSKTAAEGDFRASLFEAYTEMRALSDHAAAPIDPIASCDSSASPGPVASPVV